MKPHHYLSPRTSHAATLLAFLSLGLAASSTAQDLFVADPGGRAILRVDSSTPGAPMTALSGVVQLEASECLFLDSNEAIIVSTGLRSISAYDHGARTLQVLHNATGRERILHIAHGANSNEFFALTDDTNSSSMKIQRWHRVDASSPWTGDLSLYSITSTIDNLQHPQLASMGGGIFIISGVCSRLRVDTTVPSETKASTAGPVFARTAMAMRLNSGNLVSFQRLTLPRVDFHVYDATSTEISSGELTLPFDRSSANSWSIDHPSSFAQRLLANNMVLSVPSGLYGADYTGTGTFAPTRLFSFRGDATNVRLPSLDYAGAVGIVEVANEEWLMHNPLRGGFVRLTGGASPTATPEYVASIGSGPAFDGPIALCDGGNDALWVLDHGVEGWRIFSVSTVTGDRTLLARIPTGASLDGIARVGANTARVLRRAGYQVATVGYFSTAQYMDIEFTGDPSAPTTTMGPDTVTDVVPLDWGLDSSGAAWTLMPVSDVDLVYRASATDFLPAPSRSFTAPSVSSGPTTYVGTISVPAMAGVAESVTLHSFQTTGNSSFQLFDFITLDPPNASAINIPSAHRQMGRGGTDLLLGSGFATISHAMLNPSDSVVGNWDVTLEYTDSSHTLFISSSGLELVLRATRSARLIAVHPADDSIWFLEAFPPRLCQYDPADGSISNRIPLVPDSGAVVTEDELSRASDFIFSPDGTEGFIALSDRQSVVRVDLSTGVATDLAIGRPADFDGEEKGYSSQSLLRMVFGPPPPASTGRSWPVYE